MLSNIHAGYHLDFNEKIYFGNGSAHMAIEIRVEVCENKHLWIRSK